MRSVAHRKKSCLGIRGELTDINVLYESYTWDVFFSFKTKIAQHTIQNTVELIRLSGSVDKAVAFNHGDLSSNPIIAYVKLLELYPQMP